MPLLLGHEPVVWADAVPNTPRTVCVDVTNEELRVMAARHRSIHGLAPDEDAAVSDDESTTVPADLSAAVPDLVARIDQAMAKLAAPHGAFVKLGVRAPKDAYTWLEDRASPAGETPMQAAHRRRHLLRVHSGTEAVRLLCHSYRVYTDIQSRLRASAGDADAVARGLVAVREWIPWMRPELEFRAWVHEGVLTCASQYSTVMPVAALASRAPDGFAAQVRSALLDAWLSVCAHAPGRSVVVDFAVILCQDRQRDPVDGPFLPIGTDPRIDSVMVIEFNPFAATTGTCLFDWDRDESLLRRGRPDSAEPVFRVARV